MSSPSAFLAPVPLESRQQNRNRVRRSTLYPNACATSPATNTAAARDASVAPEAIAATGTCPISLHNTTIIHNIPAVPPHLRTPPSHPSDGDGYILALSFQRSGQPWVRGRFTRTKAFLAEAKAGARLYRGAYGTPGSSGWAAPLKPKATSAAAAFMWGVANKRRIFAFGPRALPLALDPATLVSKGPTALGAVLTDAPELANERATELAAPPVVFGDALFVAGVGRAQTGRLLGAFVTEVAADYSVRKRLPRVDIPARCVVADFAVGEKFCVLLLHRVAAGSGPGMLGTLFGKMPEQASAPEVDSEFGSFLIVVPRDGSATASYRLPNEIACRIAGVDDQGDGSLRLSLLILGGMDAEQGIRTTLRTSTLVDVQSARLWTMEASDMNLRVRRKTFDVNISAQAKGSSKTLDVQLRGDTLIEGDISLLCSAKKVSTDVGSLDHAVYTIFDHSAARAGLAVIGGGGSKLMSWTLMEDGYEVSSPLLSDDSKHVSMMVTCERCPELQARLMVFSVESVEQGPVHTVELDRETFGILGCSAGGVWVNEAVDWREDGSKPVKSAYEIFDSKRWNDIDSGFSSLGLGQ